MIANVSIVIPTWNGVDLLTQFFPSVLAAAKQYAQTTASRVEIVLVNDASTDTTEEWLTSQSPASPIDLANDGTGEVEIRWLTNEQNLGFGKTVNRGMQEAKYRLTFLLNNDVEVDVNAIAPLVENFSDPAVFAAHCRVFEFQTKTECGTGQLGSFARGAIRVHQSYRAVDSSLPSGSEGKTKQPLFSMFASGGSAMFDRDKFLAIGAFEELLSPIYWEDVDISYRAWKRGYSVLYEPRSLVYHRVSSTMGKQNRRKIRRLQQRNRLIFHWINLHDRQMIRSHLLWLLVLTLTAPLRFQPLFLLAVVDASRLLSQIHRRRGEEMRLAKRSDREVFHLFAELMQRTDIQT